MGQQHRPALIAFGLAATGLRAELARLRQALFGHVANHLAVVLRVVVVAGGIDDLQGHVGQHGLRAGFVVQLAVFDLALALENQQQTHVVPGHVSRCLLDDGDSAHGGELIEQQQALVLQAGVILRQLVHVQHKKLLEEQIQELAELVDVGGLHHHIDAHALFAHVAHVEAVRCRGLGRDGVTEDAQRLIERNADAVAQLVACLREAAQVGNAVLRKRLEWLALLNVRHEGLFILQAPQAHAHFLDGGHVETAVQLRRVHDVERQAEEQAFSRGCPHVITWRVQDVGNAHQVADAKARVVSHVGQRVPARGLKVLVVRRELVDFLPALRPEARSNLEVFALDVQHHHRIPVVEQVRNHDANAFARARGRGQEHELLATEQQKILVLLAHHDGGVLVARLVGLQQPALDQLLPRGEPCRAVQLPLFGGKRGIADQAEQQHRQADAGHQRDNAKALFLLRAELRQLEGQGQVRGHVAQAQVLHQQARGHVEHPKDGRHGQQQQHQDGDGYFFLAHDARPRSSWSFFTGSKYSSLRWVFSKKTTTSMVVTTSCMM